MSTKDLIQAELEGLDETLLADIYLFIKTFIRSKQTLSQPDELFRETTNHQEEVDPLNGFIGAVAHGSLASSIDDELYGA